MASRRSFPSGTEKREQKKTDEEEQAENKVKLFVGVGWRGGAETPSSPPSLFVCPASQLASVG